MRKTAEQLQCEALWDWAGLTMGRLPALRYLHRIPNEGSRGRVETALLVRSGLRPGMPDYCLPVPRGGYGAMYIEMKAPGRRPTPTQQAVMAELEVAGNFVVWTDSWETAAALLENYCRGRIKKPKEAA